MVPEKHGLLGFYVSASKNAQMLFSDCDTAKLETLMIRTGAEPSSHGSSPYKRMFSVRKFKQGAMKKRRHRLEELRNIENKCVNYSKSKNT